MSRGGVLATEPQQLSGQRPTDPTDGLSGLEIPPRIRNAWPAAVDAVDRLLRIAPSYRHVVNDMVRAYGDTFFRRGQKRVEEVLHLCGNDPARFEKALRSYLRFGMESLRKQVQFTRTGQYAIKAFDEISHSLYQDDAAMREYYLPALMLCFVFNPNYYEYFDFFEAQYLPAVADRGLVVEIGCGHGVYLSRTLAAHPETHGLGLDIAPGSLEVTQQMLDFCGIASPRTRLSLADVRNGLPAQDHSAQAVICCEVLEHLPDPRVALAEIRRIAVPGASLMISAAVRMESVDHLYLFRSHKEVREMIEAAGLTVRAERAIPLVKGDLTDPAERERLLEDPRVPVGFICRAEVRS